ncbi:MAG: hypothetical protein ACTS3F_14760 [Phycisphaerales bacterium]
MAGDREHDIPTRSRLACFACGYDLVSLEEKERCPECGLAVAESIRARWSGTLWQRVPGWGAWLKTMWLLSVFPWRVAPAIDGRPRPRTVLWNCGSLLVLALGPQHAVLGEAYLLGGWAIGLFMLLPAALVGLPILFFVPGLRSIERSALRWQLIGHAMFPLILSVICCLVSLVIGYFAVAAVHAFVGPPLTGGLGISDAAYFTGVAFAILTAALALAGVVSSVWVCGVGRKRLRRIPMRGEDSG